MRYFRHISGQRKKNGAKTLNLQNYFKFLPNPRRRFSLSQKIFSFSKSTIKNTRKRYEIYSKLTKKHQNKVIDVALMSLLLTLSIRHNFS